MNRVIGYDNARNVLGDFRFAEFRIVRELRFYEVDLDGQGTQKLDLVLDSDGRVPNFRLNMSFSGVTGLKLKEFGGGETRITGFDIVDITTKQWEGVSWEIIDYENGVLEFRAKTAEIRSIAECG